MEKKKIGLKIALAIIIAIIIGLLVFIVCNAVSKNSSTTQGGLKTEQSKEGLEVEYEAEKVPDTDLFASGYQTAAVILNKELYIVEDSEVNRKLTPQKVGGIEGTVKKVKAYNIDSDVQTTMFAITEEGKVYITRGIQYEANAKEYELFSNYAVEDIISIKGIYWQECEYKILLKDGRKIQINTANDEEQITTKEITTESMDEKAVDTELYAHGFQIAAFVANGNLYVIDNRGVDSLEQVLKPNKVEGIEGEVKRVRAYDISSDVETTYFAITEEGKVYTIKRHETVKQYELFSNYAVENIISIEGLENEQCEYKILLKDGRKIQINTVRNESTNNQQQVTTKEIQ